MNDFFINICILILVLFALLIFIGYIYIFYIITNLKSSPGEPYISIETNLTN